MARRKAKVDVKTDACMNPGCPRTGYLVTFVWSKLGGDHAGNDVRLFLCGRCEDIIRGACLPVCNRCDCEIEPDGEDSRAVCSECATPQCSHCGKVVTEDGIECASCNKALNEEQARDLATEVST